MKGLAVLCLLSACARNVDAVAARDRAGETAADESPRAMCSIAGQASPDASALLFSDGDEPKPFAHFNGRVLSLEVRDVPSVAVDRVGLRATTTSGFALDGWVDRAKLTFSARARIPIAGDVAWIPRGTQLTLKLGEGRRVVVSPPSRDLLPIDVIAPCAAVALGPVEAERPLEQTGELYALAGDRLAVSPAPNAPAIFTLRPRPGASLKVSVEDTGEGMHLRFTDGIAVDGWVDRSALKPLTSFGIGCGGCGVRHGLGISLPAGGVRLARAHTRTPVFVGETSGAARGFATPNAEVIVLEERAGYARVLPRCRELLPEGAFWVARGDLELGALVSNAAMLDVGCNVRMFR